MTLKDAVAAISAEANIPAKQVRIVAQALLQKMVEAIDTGDGFRAGGVSIRVRDLPQRTVKGKDGKEKEMPAKRVGIIQRVEKSAQKEQAE